MNEYAARSNLLINVQPRELFDARDAASWCPNCFSPQHAAGALSDLSAYLEIMQEIYRSEAFLVDAARQSAPVLVDLESGAAPPRRLALTFSQMMLPRLAGRR